MGKRAFWTQGLSVAALALAACAATAAGAQDDASPSDADGDVVTVYGTSNPLPVFDYPGQVSVVTRDQIELFAPSSISDALRDVPGVDFAGGPRRTGETPSIRGLSGENVLILLDGARQSFISAHDGRFFVDPDLIKTAEAVRGPASALYGSGAVGGVLAFETVDAADLLREGETAGVRVRVGYQDVNAETLAALTGFATIDDLDIVASLGLRDSGDIALGSGDALPSDDDITTGLVKGTWAISDAVELEGSWTRFTNTAFEPNNGQGTTPSSDPTLGADVEKDIESDTFRAALGLNPAANRLLDARFTAYQTTTSVDEFDESGPRSTLREIETTGFSARNASRFDFAGSEWTFTFGGDWYRDEQVGTDDTSDDGTRQGVPNGESTFMGVFAQLETRIDEPFGLPGDVVLVPGVRFDEYESKVDDQDSNEDDAISPRVAASYGPVDWFRVFASYSEGFRAPSINELYLDGPHFPVPHPVFIAQIPPTFTPAFNNFNANPNMKPEKAETLEFGAGVDFRSVIADGDRFQAKASYYDGEVDDLISLFVDQTFDATCFAPPFFPCTAGTTESENVASAEISGFEAEAVYDASRVRLHATFSSIDGENAATGEDLGALTPDRFALDARIKAPEWDAAFGARMQAAAEFEQRRLDDADAFELIDERDGYFVVDLYATWAPSFLNGVRVDAGVDNVFDEDYERVFAGVSEPGVNPRIAVSYQTGW